MFLLLCMLAYWKDNLDGDPANHSRHACRQILHKVTFGLYKCWILIVLYVVMHAFEGRWAWLTTIRYFSLGFSCVLVHTNSNVFWVRCLVVYEFVYIGARLIMTPLHLLVEVPKVHSTLSPNPTFYFSLARTPRDGCIVLNNYWTSSMWELNKA